jgi:ferredoxin
MNVDPCRDPGSPECIRCGDCVRACRFSALHSTFARDRRSNSSLRGASRIC